MKHLAVRQGPSQRWIVTDESSRIELGRHRTQAQAVAWARQHLVDGVGGRLVVHDSTGRVTHDEHLDGDDQEELEQPLSAVAAQLDEVLGRGDGAPETLFDQAAVEIGDQDINQILPHGLRNNPKIRIFNTYVSVAAGWVMFVGVVFGGGAIAGVVAPAVQASASKATIGSYLTFGSAFFATFALTVTVGLVAFALERGLYPVAAVSLTVVISLAASWLALSIGLANPEIDALVSHSGGGTYGQALWQFKTYFEFFGVVPAITGIGLGLLSAALADELIPRHHRFDQ